MLNVYSTFFGTRSQHLFLSIYLKKWLFEIFKNLEIFFIGGGIISTSLVCFDMEEIFT